MPDIQSRGGFAALLVVVVFVIYIAKQPEDEGAGRASTTPWLDKPQEMTPVSV
jgi:hypothetical protein